MNDASDRPEPPEATDDEPTPSPTAPEPAASPPPAPVPPPPAPVPPPPAPAPDVGPPPQSDYTADGVPTLDYVRDKIESRYATSLGAAELAEESSKGREIEEQLAERDEAAKARLEQNPQVAAARNRASSPLPRCPADGTHPQRRRAALPAVRARP